MIKNLLFFLSFIITSAAVASSQEYVLTPTSGTVESLQKFELVFPGATKIERNSDAPGSITITSSKKDAITGEPITYRMNGLMLFNDNKLTMTTSAAITDEGKYRLTIPLMYILVDGVPYLEEIGATYTINMKKPSVFPAEGRVESIETIKATFFDYESVEITDIKPYLLNVDTDTRIDFTTIECNKNIVNLSLSAPVTQNASYRLVFPVGSVKANDIVNEDAFDLNYVIRSSSVKVSVSPAPGTYASLPELTITFDGAQAVRHGFSYSKAPTYEINGTKKMIMSFSVADNKLTLKPNLTAEGVYTINIPADCIYVDNELHDKSYSWNYTIDPSFSSINDISTDLTLWDVYSIDGVKVAAAITEVQAANTLSKGIYILVKGPERRKIVVR